MAIASNPLETFIWGSGGSMRTPEQVAREREIAAAMMGQSMDYSPVEHWLQGAARASQGLVGGLKNRWADEAEQRGRSGFQSEWDNVFGGGQGTSAGFSPAALTGGGGSSAAIPTGENAAYIREGLISRGMPEHIADAFLLNMQDESGLNAGINELAPTVPGSRGGFGLYQLTGPRRTAYESYAQGLGLPLDSVDAQLDFLMSELSGPEAAANKAIMAAPDTGTAAAAIVNQFLRPAEQHRARREAAYLGGAAPRTHAASAGGSPDMASLLGLASNEWASPAQQSIVQSLLGQQMQQQDPRYQQQLALGDLQRQQAEIELERLRSPAAPAPDYGFIELPNGQIVRTDATSGTIQDMGQFGASPMGDFSTVTIDVPGVGPQTFNTADPAQYQAANQLLAQGATEVKTPGVSVTTNAAASAPPPGYQNVFDDQGRLVSQSIIPNGPAWQQQEAAIDTAMNTLGQIESIINDPNLSTAVGIGGVLPAIPNTAQAGLVGRIEQLQGAAFLQAFESLKGGGQITQIEGDKATQAIARLNRAQTQEDFTAALNELAKIVHTGMNRARGNIGMESIGEFKPFSAGAGQSQGAIPRTQPNTTSGGVTWSFVD